MCSATLQVPNTTCTRSRTLQGLREVRPDNTTQSGSFPLLEITLDYIGHPGRIILSCHCRFSKPAGRINAQPVRRMTVTSHKES